MRAIANWFIDRARLQGNKEVSKVWLAKIVYLAYERAIKEYKLLLTPARVEAWNFGPVFREIYFRFDEVSSKGYFEKYSFEGRKKVKATADFSIFEEKILLSIWDDYSSRAANSLVELTHRQGSAWDITWNSGGKEKPGMIIDPLIIFGREFGLGNGKQQNKD